jgi:hypothetical protein
MNPHGDSRALRHIKDAANERKRRQDAEYRTQEQLANRNAQAIACRDPARREEEQVANTARWRTRHEQPRVLEHKAIQRATAREEPGRREEEQVANTAQRHARHEQPGV